MCINLILNLITQRRKDAEEGVLFVNSAFLLCNSLIIILKDMNDMLNLLSTYYISASLPNRRFALCVRYFSVGAWSEVL
jgi:F0F1-type ATP synthase assembly protein I